MSQLDLSEVVVDEQVRKEIKESSSRLIQRVVESKLQFSTFQKGMEDLFQNFDGEAVKKISSKIESSRQIWEPRLFDVTNFFGSLEIDQNSIDVKNVGSLIDQIFEVFPKIIENLIEISPVFVDIFESDKSLFKDIGGDFIEVVSESFQNDIPNDLKKEFTGLAVLDETTKAVQEQRDNHMKKSKLLDFAISFHICEEAKQAVGGNKNQFYYEIMRNEFRISENNMNALAIVAEILQYKKHLWRKSSDPKKYIISCIRFFVLERKRKENRARLKDESISEAMETYAIQAHLDESIEIFNIFQALEKSTLDERERYFFVYKYLLGGTNESSREDMNLNSRDIEKLRKALYRARPELAELFGIDIDK